MYLIHYYYCPPKHQGRAQRSDMQKSENKNIFILKELFGEAERLGAPNNGISPHRSTQKFESIEQNTMLKQLSLDHFRHGGTIVTDNSYEIHAAF